ncbi:uncharacterized protein LY79DRAFT_415090 [Colletotrichum navitas]|uniref:Uncharacterized protein n=1 Tax=Colletotrichum navitas TaxID=681940 RepID=A0AAD8V0F8_9PEZI|nr:uncharacterized protein LY79DRAFT_415090 [Colletotrichum navitas]KAK1573225.1 hypothetical protein LY79DRAFT_415090 [Colletotrichum navitas]
MRFCAYVEHNWENGNRARHGVLAREKRYGKLCLSTLTHVTIPNHHRLTLRKAMQDRFPPIWVSAPSRQHRWRVLIAPFRHRSERKSSTGKIAPAPAPLLAAVNQLHSCRNQHRVVFRLQSVNPMIQPTPSSSSCDGLPTRPYWSEQNTMSVFTQV